MAKRYLPISLMLFMLSACVTPYQSDSNRRAPVLIEDRTSPANDSSPSVVDETVLEEAESELANPLLDTPEISSEPLLPEKSESPVVESLLASADQQSFEGDEEGAANSLERALRIEPRNASLWSRLAQIRFDQQEWQQAIQLAAKSNVLSGDSQALRRRNWYLMANAYDAMGDMESAQKYRDKVTAASF